MTGLVMRDAREEDLPAIVAMLADDEFGRAREDASLPLDPGYVAAFRAIDGSDRQRLIVAELDGRLVGTLQLGFLAGLSMHGAWRGLIEAVRIDGSLRGRGLGSQLVEWAVGECRARGCMLVQLTSHRDRADAHRFYERLGWEQSHAGFKLKLD
ncbi:GNAT family N-acetyltransferase [Novosphingobium mangrovi (ex Huang et al. 2023)]|uniref:GNAT family N-acetyltransferase n=1 Tax=Novosphingobium mangrovi (ex Huang et al. 2023) TaxID=2976432 RepID=A0ABT2I2X0_9SPHN|nr:GNAT family N-acetyltransferase [Novosphingobium mangrovi (ex Huang et al. 2023)]MCT2399145.1 GNAT family N-acetyltransferase [Novosphingobium mangrovi (ex Huang et al. 2023)]